MSRSARPPAYRRYFKRHMVFTALYIAAVMLGVWLVPDDSPPGVFAVSLALLPGLAVVGWIWAMGRLLVELDDEYLRMLEVRKFIIATGIALAVASVWGIVELFAAVPRVPVFFVFPLWCVGLAVGSVANKIRFGHDTGSWR